MKSEVRSALITNNDEGSRHVEEQSTGLSTRSIQPSPSFDKSSSIKLLEKQRRKSFKFYRKDNAFLNESDLLLEQEAPQGVDHEETSKTDVDWLTDTLAFLIGLFSNDLDSEMVLNDTRYQEAIILLSEKSSRVEDGLPREVQFLRRRRLFKVFIANKEGIFFTFGKMLELHICCGWGHEKSDEDTKDFSRLLASHIILIMVNGTDCNINVGKRLCRETGILETLVTFIRAKEKSYFRNELQNTTEFILLLITQLFYNCSMDYANRDILRRVGALEAVLPFMDSKDRQMELVALLCVAHLADEKQSSIFQAKLEPIHLLVSRIQEASASEDKRDTLGWLGTELIKGLGRLALNDANKAIINDAGALPILLEVVRMNDYPSEQFDAMEVLWTLSFEETAIVYLANQEPATRFFEALVSKDSHPCKAIADGILWNTSSGSQKLNDAPNIKANSNVTEPSRTPYIMMSYQWDSQKLAVKVKEVLTSQGYHVWIDVERMAGSTLEAMAKAVEGADVVLMFVSKRYKDSQNCRAEAEYTFKTRRPFIPILVEPDYRADGWLGIMMGVKLYYDISREENLNEKMTELTRALSQESSLTANSTADESAQQQTDRFPSNGIFRNASASAPINKSVRWKHTTSQQCHTCAYWTQLKHSQPQTPDIKDWNAERTAIWMRTNNIESNTTCTSGRLQGCHLYFLWKMKQESPTVYYKFIQENLLLTDIHQMAVFTNALEAL